MKVFGERKITNVRGRILPYGEFRLFSDMENPTFDKDKISRVVKEAEGFANREIPMLPASLYRQFFVTGNRVNFETPYFLRRDMLVRFALAEAYEGEGRFTEKLLDTAWAIMEESTWMIPAHLYCSPLYGESTLGPVLGDNSLHGIDLFSASTAASLAVAYLYCKDILDRVDPIIAKKIEYTVHERAIKSFLQYEPWWGGARGNKINNWCPWIVSNILLSTAIIEKETYIRERVVNKAIEYIDNFMNCYKPDGGCDEGPAYWGGAGASLFDCLELIEDLSGGKVSIYDSELVKNIGDYIYKVNINGSRFVNFADCAPKTHPSPSAMIRYGQKTGSPFLVSFGKKQAQYGDYLFSASHMYRSLKSLVSKTPDSESCPMPLGTWLPNLGVMTARQYSDSAKGMFLAAKGGNNGEMHNHNDVGNFMVYYNGEPVIIDTGVGAYTKQTFSPERYQLWFMQSGYHNLPSFNGVDQRDGERYRATDVLYNEEKHELTSELRSAYPPEASIDSYIRRIGMENGIVTLTESVRLTKVCDIDFHMVLAQCPSITKDGTVSLPEGRTLTYDTSLTAEIEEFDPVGMSTKEQWNTEKLYRLHFGIKADNCNVTFTIK